MFISLEGGEGTGKSTQARLLAERLATRGITAVVTREPGGSEGAEAIRTLLMNGDVGRWSARTELLLFAAARADHVERVIRPALADRRWVICDRYVDSTRAYQGLAGDVTDAEIMALHGFGTGGLMPDRTLVLDLAASDGARRAAQRDGGAADRFARRGAAFHDAVAAAFRQLAAGEPGRMRVIDADGDVGAVAERIDEALADLTS